MSAHLPIHARIARLEVLRATDYRCQIKGPRCGGMLHLGHATRALHVDGDQAADPLDTSRMVAACTSCELTDLDPAELDDRQRGHGHHAP